MIWLQDRTNNQICSKQWFRLFRLELAIFPQSLDPILINKKNQEQQSSSLFSSIVDWQFQGDAPWWRYRRGSIDIWGEVMSYTSLFINIIPHNHTPQFFWLHKDPLYQQPSPSPACSGFLIPAFTIARHIAEAGTKIGTKGFRVSPEMATVRKVDTSKSILHRKYIPIGQKWCIFRNRGKRQNKTENNF